MSSPGIGQQTVDQQRNQILTQVLAAIQDLSTTSLFPLKEVTGSVALATTDAVVIVSAAGGAATATLPAASSFGSSKLYLVAKSDVSANAVTITPTGTDKISGAATKALSTQYAYAILLSYSAGWMLFSA